MKDGDKSSTDFTYDAENVTSAISAIYSWLREEGNYKDTFVYRTMIPLFEAEDLAKSFALRLLIHYIGDIH